MINKNRSLAIISIMLSVSYNIQSQNLKAYNGNFNTVNFQGTTTYQYTEGADERVFNGPFTFKTQNGSVNIIGSYKNNLKTGAWKISLTNVPASEIMLKYSITATAGGSFLNGDMQGTWTLNRNKLITVSKSGISTYYQGVLNGLSYLFNGETADLGNKTSTATENSIANFKDNRFTGRFSYNVNGGKSKVDGQFDENGYFDGVWIVNYFEGEILHQLTKTYKNGVLVLSKEKNNSTGSVKTWYDNTKTVNSFFKNYDASTNIAWIDDDNLPYTLSKETNFDKGDFIGQAISVWYNNNSLINSAYTFEMERGSNKMGPQLQRSIIVDEQEMNKIKRENERIIQQQKSKEDSTRQAKYNQKVKDYAEIRKEIEFEQTDFGKLQKSVKKDFEKWLKKGEFETNEDYKKRINAKADITFNHIRDSIINNDITRFRIDNEMSIGTLKDYNIENQTFTVTWDNGSIPDLKIPSKLAQAFSDPYRNAKNNHRVKILIKSLDYGVLNNNWITTKIIIFFDSRNGDESFGRNMIIQKGNEYYYGTGKKSDKKILDIKSLEGLNKVPDEIYYYERKSSLADKTQPLNFSYTDLGIKLPE